jgi:hypothetical protein
LPPTTDVHTHRPQKRDLLPAESASSTHETRRPNSTLRCTLRQRDRKNSRSAYTCTHEPHEAEHLQRELPSLSTDGVRSGVRPAWIYDCATIKFQGSSSTVALGRTHNCGSTKRRREFARRPQSLGSLKPQVVSQHGKCRPLTAKQQLQVLIAIANYCLLV